LGVTIDFCGETYELVGEKDELTIGREADLVIDDNRFLHRRFLRIYQEGGMWWVANVGSQLSATLADQEGMVQAWLSPGARLPLVFARYSVWFTAGPTTYEFDIAVDSASYVVVAPDPGADVSGGTTFGRTTLTPDQRLLLVALAEPALRRRGRGAVNAPTSAEAAARLGWAVTKFNRKLDNVCQKLERLGVRGLHGGPERLATDRKSRLVEYALSARLVSAADLTLLDSASTPAPSG
jgi:hypothetical protein